MRNNLGHAVAESLATALNTNTTLTNLAGLCVITLVLEVLSHLLQPLKQTQLWHICVCWKITLVLLVTTPLLKRLKQTQLWKPNVCGLVMKSVNLFRKNFTMHTVTVSHIESLKSFAFLFLYFVSPLLLERTRKCKLKKAKKNIKITHFLIKSFTLKERDEF